MDGTGTVRSHDVPSRSGHRKESSLTPKSSMSGVSNGTTVSRLCHYLDDSLQKISQATEQIEVTEIEVTVYLSSIL